VTQLFSCIIDFQMVIDGINVERAVTRMNRDEARLPQAVSARIGSNYPYLSKDATILRIDGVSVIMRKVEVTAVRREHYHWSERKVKAERRQCSQISHLNQAHTLESVIEE